MSPKPLSTDMLTITPEILALDDSQRTARLAALDPVLPQGDRATLAGRGLARARAI